MHSAHIGILFAEAELSKARTPAIKSASLGFESFACNTGKANISMSQDPTGVHLDEVDAVLKKSSLDPFVSLTFTKVEIVTFSAKIWKVYMTTKKLLQLVNSVFPIIDLVQFYACILLVVLACAIFWDFVDILFDDWLLRLLIVIAICLGILKVVEFLFTIWFTCIMDPLRILIEAYDIMGNTTHFLITDKRSRTSRMLGLGVGNKMELTRLDEPDTSILVTSIKYLCVSLCVPSKISLNRVVDGSSVALLPLYRICKTFVCCLPTVTTVTCTDSSVVFVQPCCQCADENVIQPSVRLGENQMSVKSSGFSFKDFFLETVDFSVEDILGENAANVAHVVQVAQEANEVKDDYKDALAAFKEQGYQKIGGPDSTWTVTYAPDTPDTEKYAALLFVITKFMGY